MTPLDCPSDKASENTSGQRNQTCDVVETLDTHMRRRYHVRDTNVSVQRPRWAYASGGFPAREVVGLCVEKGPRGGEIAEDVEENRGDPLCRFELILAKCG